MKILGIESSGMVASVAVLEDERMLAEYTIDHKKTHSQTLVPMLDEIKNMIELDLSEIDAIAVSAGPGSFTGLRIGSATAKGLGLALKKPIISVPTIEAMAYNLCESEKLICPIMDARRGQVYTGIYGYQEEIRKTYLEQCLLMMEDLAEKINKIGQSVIFLGDGVPVFREKIAELIKVPYSFAPAHKNRQRAGALGTLAMQYYIEENGSLGGGHVQTAEEHRPDYLRPSQAERELEEKQRLEKSVQ